LPSYLENALAVLLEKICKWLTITQRAARAWFQERLMDLFSNVVLMAGFYLFYKKNPVFGYSYYNSLLVVVSLMLF